MKLPTSVEALIRILKVHFVPLQDASINKGDLVAASAGKFERLTVGPDTNVLAANSAQALGVEWATTDSIIGDKFAAKGDILVGTGAGTFQRHAVGADTEVLTADAAEGDGVKWAAAAGGVDIKYCQTLQSVGLGQAVNTGAWTAVQFDVNGYDPYNWHNPAANNTRITVDAEGFYLLGAFLHGVYISGDWRFEIQIHKNGFGTPVCAHDHYQRSVGHEPDLTTTGFNKANATDFYELWVYQDSGTNWALPFGAFKYPTLWVMRMPIATW